MNRFHWLMWTTISSLFINQLVVRTSSRGTLFTLGRSRRSSLARACSRTHSSATRSLGTIRIITYSRQDMSRYDLILFIIEFSLKMNQLCLSGTLPSQWIRATIRSISRGSLEFLVTLQWPELSINRALTSFWNRSTLSIRSMKTFIPYAG